MDVDPASVAWICLGQDWLACQAWVVGGTWVPAQSGPLTIDFARQDPCPPFPHTFCKIPLHLISTSDRDDNSQSRTALQESTVKKSVKMAQEISDIKKVRIDSI